LANLLKIHVIKDEDELEMLPLKDLKKNYDVLGKCQNVWTTQFPWVEMLRSETGDVHHVK
jgi:hypothetical protein